jgi:hypothetical protein
MTSLDISDRERARRQRQREDSLAQRPGQKSFTITQWCVRRRVSRAMYYKLKRRGKAPLTYDAGGPRISDQADADWLREREAEAQSQNTTAA